MTTIINKVLLYLNPINWFYWINSKLRKIYTPKDIYQFYLYIADRAAICSPCMKEGKCIHCTCKVPQMFFEKKECHNWNNPEEIK
jgi:hypothetical protein